MHDKLLRFPANMPIPAEARYLGYNFPVLPKTLEDRMKTSCLSSNAINQSKKSITNKVT